MIIASKRDFLVEIESIVLRKELQAAIGPQGSPAQGADFRRIGAERIRLYYMEHSFYFSELGAEEMLFDVESPHRFSWVGMNREPVDEVPDPS